ncbi:hypothetical protein JTB14_001173 [Gonioctena quinquepunctata]|nr:hypothetical protein JTB14_001173 [Gonioctena quinquepunctata]
MPSVCTTVSNPRKKYGYLSAEKTFYFFTNATNCGQIAVKRKPDGTDIRISYFTPPQQQYLTNLRTALETEQQSEEQNFTVEYVGNIPKIVTTSKTTAKGNLKEEDSPGLDIGMKTT